MNGCEIIKCPFYIDKKCHCTETDESGEEICVYQIEEEN